MSSQSFSPLTIEEAKFLIRYARCIIECSLSSHAECRESTCIEYIPEDVLNKFTSIKLPVFVSIERLVTSEGITRRMLRGSMGIPKPIFNLLEGVKYAAYYAAFCDPRRGPLQHSDWSHCALEITIMSEPRQVTPSELYTSIVPGYHAITVEEPNGMLNVVLPHNFVEVLEKLVSERGRVELSLQELVDLVLKSRGITLSSDCTVYVHDTQIFCELFPNGDVIERKLFRNRLFRLVKSETTRQQTIQQVVKPR